MDKYNPQNIQGSVKGVIRPTPSKFRLESSKFNIVSELSSSDLNKHEFGTHDYGQIFLKKGFPVFGELYPYSSYDTISIFNPATLELDSTRDRTITTSANVNTVRISAGQDRKVITLVDSNFSDISNADYNLFGKIDLSSVYLSPLGLDSCFKVDDRMYWEDTDDDFSVVKYYTKAGIVDEFGEVEEPTNWYINPFFVYGNDRPFLYDTRVNMYSGSSIYPEAFGMRVFAKIYMNTPLQNRDIYSQAMLNKKYHNNGLYGIYELELVHSFKDLADFKDSPKYGMLRYKSDVLKKRQHNPYATDTLVLHLPDFYEEGLIWDSIISEYVKVRDLDIDIVITVDEHTSRLQPEILGIDIASKNSETLNEIDLLKNSFLDQVQVLQSYDPINFPYFSKGQINIANPVEGLEQDAMYSFPLAGSQIIRGHPNKNAPVGLSRLVKEMAYDRVIPFHLDASDPKYSIIPPPQIFLEKDVLPVGYAKVGADLLLNFYATTSHGPVVLDDGTTQGNEFSVSSLHGMARRLLYYLQKAYVTEASTPGEVAEDFTAPVGQEIKYHWSNIFSIRNPWESSQADGSFLPSVSDLNLITNGIMPSGWGSVHGKNPYGADPIEYGNLSYRPFGYRVGLYGIFDTDATVDCLGLSGNYTPETENQYHEASNFVNHVRLSYNRWLWSFGVEDLGVYPSSLTVPKQYIHPSNPDNSRLFNDRTYAGFTPEPLSYALRNTSKATSENYVGGDPLNEVCLPWEDLMWVYAKDSSNIMTMEKQLDRNRLKIEIDFTDYATWNGGDGYDNITAFVGNLDVGNIIRIPQIPFIAPMYMRKDIKLLPDLNKIVYESHNTDYIEVVNTFMSGSWKLDLLNGSQTDASNMLTKLFSEWKNSTKDISELFNVDSPFYDALPWEPNMSVNYFGTFILLWQYYLWKYYKESIYNRISDDIKIVERSPYTNSSDKAYKFYIGSNGGAYYPYRDWSGDFDRIDAPSWGENFKTEFYDSANIDDSVFHAMVSHQGDNTGVNLGYRLAFPLSLEALDDMFKYIDRWGETDWDEINIDSLDSEWTFLEQ
jgi:hypothetical protein